MNTMDSSAHHHVVQSTLTPVSSSRRHPRENETEAQRQKREKAAERQRRKRERDRTVNNLNAIMAFTQAPEPQPQQTLPPSPQQSSQNFAGQELTPEELQRRERVRAAARDRQRKHRQQVKQRKMRELGLEMTNEIMSGMDEAHFRVTSEGQYHPVPLPHEMQHHEHPMNQQDPPPFPPQLTGGQSFASTLLLSFSCAPLLKQHLLRTLSMTSDELASLEPIIADAWDQWDHQRRMHYAQAAQQVANATKDGSMPGPSNATYPGVEMTDGTVNGFGDPSQPHASEFRARFHRSLAVPSPFRAFTADASATATTSTPTSTGSGPSSDPIDPHLTTVVVGDGRQKVTLDPDFGQAKGEAEGVVGRLERS
ncbi:hypothetical protein BV22DRAFT_1114023 [Leucogyrophana mollusca]|uniref:Uncharacterized protein n=1 Tax=Leucogyrophana mollusca TaxID=85980 RepID=A0ACB8B931_9AGAM|nr:hypothetical protein BV22DRAFT_1114023 [Leucogyrophana mollusca]